MSGPLSEKIAKRIRTEGPLTLAAYMAMALHDPVAGYYATHEPIGAAGDFANAPFDVVQKLFARRIHQPIEAFLGNRGREIRQSGTQFSETLFVLSAKRTRFGCQSIQAISENVGILASRRVQLLKLSGHFAETPLEIVVQLFLGVAHVGFEQFL